MSGLVSGYSGIIAPPNLATNGAFKINQRGITNESTWTPIKADDYVCDAWFVIGTSLVDYIECKHSVNGWISFQGYGKKGQLIQILNKDIQGFGHDKKSVGGVNALPLSASAVIQNPSAGVDLIARAIPKFGIWHNVVQEPETLCKAGTNTQLKPSIFYGDSNPNYTSSGRLIVELEEDGEFLFTVHSYQLVRGLYKNMPWTSPVPYADDLARCERYYQTRTAIRSHGRPLKTSSTSIVYREDQAFTTVMAATPTISIISAGAAGDHLAFDGTGSTSSTLGLPSSMIAGNITSRGFNGGASYAGISTTLADKGADFGIATWYSWTAEVV
jgi:hypothetical protein